MKTSILSSLRNAAVISAALLSLTLSAQTTDLKHSDKSFIEKAAKAGNEEVAISRVALERTANPQVKGFAQMVVDDHSAANEALASLAISKGVSLPAKDMAASKWTTKNAKDFDEDYIKKMVADHKDAVELFQKEAEKGTDTDTVAFARSTLPKLQHHLEMATDLKKMMK